MTESRRTMADAIREQEALDSAETRARWYGLRPVWVPRRDPSKSWVGARYRKASEDFEQRWRENPFNSTLRDYQRQTVAALQEADEFRWTPVPDRRVRPAHLEFDTFEFPAYVPPEPSILDDLKATVRQPGFWSGVGLTVAFLAFCVGSGLILSAALVMLNH